MLAIGFPKIGQLVNSELQFPKGFLYFSVSATEMAISDVDIMAATEGLTELYFPDVSTP